MMEEVLERGTIPPEYEDIVLYDDNGKRVTKLSTLRSIAEAQRIVADWVSFMEDHR